MDPNDELVAYQAALRNLGADPAPLAAMAAALADLQGDALTTALAQFEAAANHHEYVWDSDYGALLLEALGDACADPARRRVFYEAAQGRATVFASWATSGGEGLARMVDVERLGGKLGEGR